MKTTTIDIGKQFSRTLGPRYRRHGEHSGEEFRDTMLEPAFLQSDIVIVNLDSIIGYSASFFEESFGGLVRKHGLENVNKKLQIVALRRPYLVPKIEAWMTEAGRSNA